MVVDSFFSDLIFYLKENLFVWFYLLNFLFILLIIVIFFVIVDVNFVEVSFIKVVEYIYFWLILFIYSIGDIKIFYIESEKMVKMYLDVFYFWKIDKVEYV